MNLEKVIFGFFIVLAATLNFGFVYGDPTDPDHHHLWEFFAAFVVNVIATALKAANLVGKGLYGVDLKQIGSKYYVIEVNDNPSIEAGCEDLRWARAGLGRGGGSEHDLRARLELLDALADVTDLLRYAVEMGASDLHLKVGNVPFTSTWQIPSRKPRASAYWLARERTREYDLATTMRRNIELWGALASGTTPTSPRAMSEAG